MSGRQEYGNQQNFEPSRENKAKSPLKTKKVL
jgi:hypothetical protein